MVLPTTTATATATATPTQVPPTATVVPTVEAPTLVPPPSPTPASTVRSNALADAGPTLAPTPATRTTPEPIGPERIVFPAGATSVTRQLDLAVDGAKVFILTAHADQLLTISVTQTGTSIDVVGPDGAALDATDGSIDGNWTFYLPLEGEYVVLLQGSGLGQVTFTLPVEEIGTATGRKPRDLRSHITTRPCTPACMVV